MTSRKKHHAKTGNSRWTAEAIRALGAITDLQTLADIFGCSVWIIPQDGADR